MSGETLRVALIHEVFPGDAGDVRLHDVLRRAARAGAGLAVLPELPLDPWWPATREMRPEHAEEPGGARQTRLARAARETGIGVLGGAIVRDPVSGRRFNRGCLVDARGTTVGTYDKLHLPCEEGFWESEHYEPGDKLPQRIDGFGLPLGLQICSDLQRPQLVHFLAAIGVEVILAPRATPPSSYERWRTVIRAAAITACCYVISVNRPRDENDVALGGPSLAVGPDGEPLLESTDMLQIVTLERGVLAEARRAYPGYLEVRSALYSEAWKLSAERNR